MRIQKGYEGMIAGAARENNPRRSYLAVNRKQGKHVPVSPGEAFDLYRRLADELRDVYQRERLLLIGFAETATAIGAFLAAERNTLYMQTTREDLKGIDCLYFSESHSHAPEQKLALGDLRDAAGRSDRIVFVEDELTTGNTVLAAIRAIRTELGEEIRGMRFSVISVLNGMDETALRTYAENGIGLHYLIKSDHRRYAGEAASCRADGEYVDAVLTEPPVRIGEISVPGRIDSRRLTDASSYRESCRMLAKNIMEKISFQTGEKILVLGTEEFMYPALFTGMVLEEKGCIVRSHATTRSPITVSSEQHYPLHCRYRLASVYDRARKTFLYDLERYDRVLVITDADPVSREGVNSLVHALYRSGNDSLYLVRWRR